jgi:hypothetical protein
MSPLCEERQRLQAALLEASMILRSCLNAEAYAVNGGRVDPDLKRWTTKAQVEHRTAKAALLRHIREHGCSTFVLP